MSTADADRPVTGKPAPDFELPATGRRTLRLADYKGSAVVLYFYPRDATPGCTTESQDFRDAHEAFTDAGAAILGISQDPMASHEKFRDKQSLPFALLSDESGEVCRAYHVLKMKNMYGKQFEGIERSTFLIDGQAVLRRAWRKVKVTGHVADVLEAVQAL